MAKKADDEMVQSTIRLPSSLFNRLEASNKQRGGRGVSEEIRRRLEASFERKAPEDWDDPRTTELLDAISYLDTSVRTYYGAWPKDRFAFEVLQKAIDRVLVQRFQPSGEAKAKPSELADVVFGEGEHLRSATEMGRMIAAIWLSSNPRRED